MDESNETRQDNERSSLLAIYGHQFEAIKTKKGSWKPLECSLFLTSEVCADPKKWLQLPHVKLLVKCSSTYPDSIPTIQVQSSNGLSRDKCNELQIQLKTLAETLIGEVMIFELAQYAEKFLLDNNSPGFESCYEEMIIRKKNQEEEDLAKKLNDEIKKKEEMRNEIFSKQQAVKKALRRKRFSGDKNSESCDFNEEVSSPEKDKLINEWDIQFDDTAPYPISKLGQSRFETEFQYIKWLGRGAFGDVIKVKNKLDGGLYAVKRIPLNAANKQLNKRITREVKLLSRLNHENVVRYYNSWIESADAISNTEAKKSSCTGAKQQSLETAILTLLPKHELSFDWNSSKVLDSVKVCSSPGDEDDDDEDDDSWISFKEDSNEVSQDHATSSDCVDGSSHSSSLRMFMYIQMELCEKETLRTSIDLGLYSDSQRVWKLFREIVEGLSHIHQQGIIHRDLKPVNIFISHGDRVKIGDFGLATTIILQKQAGSFIEMNVVSDGDRGLSLSGNMDSSHTGHVGTALYIAPELDTHENKVSYNEKVDIYSLGVIFFEMCHPPWSTKMEQYKVITELRFNKPRFPDSFLYHEDSAQYFLIRWMLTHDIRERPTSHELLSSKFIPPPQLEESELRHMVKQTLSNSQTKDYKHLIASCFNQATPAVVNATFDISAGHSSRFMVLFEFVCGKLRSVFLRHGAVSFIPPLFTPDSDKHDTSVRLMTRWGGIVSTTHDLRTPFARFLARNSHQNRIKRYAIEKVYRERRVLGLHPKEVFECAVDIVTSTQGYLIPETELLFMIWEIINDFPALLKKNCVIKINHSGILDALLLHCGLHKTDKWDWSSNIFKVKNEFDVRMDYETILRSADITDNLRNLLNSLLSLEGCLEDIKHNVIAVLRDQNLIESCLTGFNQLQTIISFANDLGIKLNFVVSLGVIQNAHHYCGLMFQLVVDQRIKQKMAKTVLISGGRYDFLVNKCRQLLLVPTDTNQFAVGFCIALDKFIYCLNNDERSSAYDVLICTMGRINNSTQRLYLLRDLWKCGVRTYFAQSNNNLEELENFCEEFNIPHFVILKEAESSGLARVRSWNKEKFSERKIPLNELVDYLVRALKNSPVEPTVSSKTEIKSFGSIENANIHLIALDKLSATSKRRFESQIKNALASTCEKLSSHARIEIVGLFLECEALKLLSYCIESKFSDDEVSILHKKFPKHKKYVIKIIDCVTTIKKNYSVLVIILFSLTDSIFRVIL